MVDFVEDYSRIYELNRIVTEDSIAEITLSDLHKMVFQLKDRIAMLRKERTDLRKEIKSLRFGDGSYSSSWSELEEVLNPNWGKVAPKTFAGPDPRRELTSDVKVQDLNSVVNKDTIFYNQKVVITGIFIKFQFREDLAMLLKSYGADINGSISRKTTIVVCGSDFGPAKILKVNELIQSGIDIKVIHETELYSILENIK